LEVKLLMGDADGSAQLSLIALGDGDEFGDSAPDVVLDLRVRTREIKGDASATTTPDVAVAADQRPG
jgi:hypothetical protein